MSLLLEQLRCECHLVRCHIPELQFVKNTLSIKPVCLLVRRLTVQILPRSVIHMVDGFTNIPLRKICKDSPLRDDHPEHGVNILDAAFLVASHRITVINLRTGITVLI